RAAQKFKASRLSRRERWRHGRLCDDRRRDRQGAADHLYRRDISRLSNRASCIDGFSRDPGMGSRRPAVHKSVSRKDFEGSSPGWFEHRRCNRGDAFVARVLPRRKEGFGDMRSSLQELNEISRAEYAMGTVVEISVWTRDPGSVSFVDAAMLEFKRLEQMFNRFDDRSELSGVNRGASRGPIEVCREFFSV